MLHIIFCPWFMCGLWKCTLGVISPAKIVPIWQCNHQQLRCPRSHHDDSTFNATATVTPFHCYLSVEVVAVTLGLVDSILCGLQFLVDLISFVISFIFLIPKPEKKIMSLILLNAVVIYHKYKTDGIYLFASRCWHVGRQDGSSLRLTIKQKISVFK